MAPQSLAKLAQMLGGNPRKRIKASTNAIDEEVAKRRAIVKSNPGMSAQELCGMFDHRRVKLSAKWMDAGIHSWVAAYRLEAYRSRIQTMISKDRGK